jgi:nitroimidazol reductase NimA-like FMN-containing flavoprotein (pyridoxamine 5'-phosphate oxidase superfamily)
MSNHLDFDTAGLERLTRAECFALLRSVPIGRIVFTEAALPAIQPLNFVVDGEDVIIRTKAGSKLATAARSAVVAFEVDQYDEETFTGWDVVLIGRAHAVSDPDDQARLAQLPLVPWAVGSRSHFIRIVPEIVRGRRIRAAVPAT